MAKFKDIANETAEEIGIVLPSAIFGISDEDAVLVSRFINSACQEILEARDWQDLVTPATFTTTGTELQFNIREQFPDYERMVKETFFNRSLNWRIRGSMDPEAWRAAELLVPTLEGVRFRIYRGGFYLLKNRTAGRSVAFEYVSNYFVTTAKDSSPAAAVTADDDDILFDKRLVVLGAKWRLLKQAGLEFNIARAEYIQRLAYCKAKDVPPETVSLNGNRGDLYDAFASDDGTLNVVLT